MKCLKCNKSINENPRYGLHEKCFIDWFKLTNNDFEFKSIIRKTLTNEQNEPLYISSLFQGKFKKYTATLENREYILKVQEEEYPELPLTEYLCNKVASLLKIKVANYYLINFHDKITFVSENFLPEYGTAHMIHIYHYFKNKMEFNVKNLTKIIKNKTGRLKDIERFLEICLFDSLIGNHDRHGRNLALIETTKGITLTPFYDNPGYLGIEDESLLEAQHSPRGKIYTKESKEPTLKDYKMEIQRLGYTDVIERFKKKCNLTEILDIFNQSNLSIKRKKALIKLISDRYQELYEK